MIQTLRRSLGAKILLLAALNLLLLIAIGLFASGVRFPRSAGQLLLQAAEPRLQDVARRIALEIERTTPEQAAALLDRFNAEYRTRFLLVRNDGSLVAGAPLRLPDEVVRALQGPPPAGGAFPPQGPPKRPEERPDRLGPPDPSSGLRMPMTPARLVSVSGGPKHWIVLRTPIRFAGTDITPGSLIVVPYGLFGDPLLFPDRWLWWMFASLAVTAFCWWPFLRGVTSSLRQMERATGEIAHGRFNTKVGIDRPDEIGRLSSSIESMASRLDVMVSGQKRFLGDTAHELRSPLGRMQIALELLDSRVNEKDRAYVGDLKEDVEALRILTDDLLQYARAELAGRSRELTSVALAPLVERVVAREAGAAPFEVQVDPAAVVRADPQLLERAISNVVRNAVKYAGGDGPIRVTAAREGTAIVLSVIDQGPGVAAESIERIFEPFYREDAARNRKTGGVGLGLAIVRTAVEACGGTASCRNHDPRGFEVRLSLTRA